MEKKESAKERITGEEQAKEPAVKKTATKTMDEKSSKTEKTEKADAAEEKDLNKQEMLEASGETTTEKKEMTEADGEATAGQKETTEAEGKPTARRKGTSKATGKAAAGKKKSEAAGKTTAEKKETTEQTPAGKKETTKAAGKKGKSEVAGKAAAEKKGTTKTAGQTTTGKKRTSRAAGEITAKEKESAKPDTTEKTTVQGNNVAQHEARAEGGHTPEANIEPVAPPLPMPRRSVAFIGSECYPFVKTGGLGDVMYALPKALIAQNCDVKVILPRYKCIPWEYQEKMVYRGAFEMNLCADGRSFYVGIMEYVWDGVVYDFIDNEEFFGYGNPYTNLIEDIPRFCYFAKAALAALNYMDWIPDVIHCHDWQAGLVPVYLRTMFDSTPVGRAKVMLTIHNLRFQGIYNIPTIRYWSGLPDYVFNKDALMQDYTEANIFKGGLAYSNMITTVSGTYAGEIQSPYYGEKLDAHLRYHSGKMRGIVNGIDYGMWNPATDDKLASPYDITNVLDRKKQNKLALQEELGLQRDEGKFVIALISRLTNQKGLDLVNAILPALIDGNTQVVVLGTGDPWYEDSFRYYEGAYRGSVCSNIMYDEGRAHKIYAGADVLLVPSQFEPCGLTQLIAMHYGTVPIVRETGGLKDTVQPYNQYTNDGNGFTFDRYDAGLLLDAINRAKTLYFTNRWCWDEMVQRDMAKDVSWENSAKRYRTLYLELTQ